MGEVRQRVRANCEDCGATCYFDADAPAEAPICPECRKGYEQEFDEFAQRAKEDEYKDYEDLDEDKEDEYEQFERDFVAMAIYGSTRAATKAEFYDD